MEALILILLATGIAAIFFRRHSRRSLMVYAEIPATHDVPEISTTPDKPVDFGYKTFWIAARAKEPNQLAELLDLKDVVAANWATGIATAYLRTHVFVSPPINGWVLAVGPLPDPCNGDKELAQWRALMTKVSSALGEAQFFANHRVSSYVAWAKYVGGKELRLFAQADEPLFEIGEPTPEEADLIQAFFDPASPDAERDDYWDRGDLRYPEEDDVMTLAARWSVSPMDLESMELEPGSAGLLGRP